MLQTAFLIALCAFSFVMFRELSEHSTENKYKGFPDWWNTKISHVNKDNWGPKFLPFLPKKISIFLFRTVLVWTTDAEHFFQLLSLFCILAIVFILGTWQLVLVAYLAQTLAGFLKSFTNIS